MSLLRADARYIPLAEGSVHMCMTSPPYWGLRDYGLATWEGGDAGCDHKIRRFEQAGNSGSAGHQARVKCPKCGAVRHEPGIGLEPMLEEYVANIVQVFREVWRVLRDDGTLWLNLGDCYNAAPKGSLKGQDKSGLTSTRTQEHSPVGVKPLLRSLKPKDLIGLPWRVAFALQADGWYLRSDIIWHKPNPMPESVRDRPTKSHEYLFLLSKQPRYYYDAQAIAEPANPKHFSRYSCPINIGQKETSGAGRPGGAANTPGMKRLIENRNRRDVWTIATQPYKGAHFATFPEKLVEPCVLAGTSARGVCPECGAPWERMAGRGATKDVAPSSIDRFGNGESGVHRKVGSQYQKWMDEHPIVTTGWRPTCDHYDDRYRAEAIRPRSARQRAQQDAQYKWWWKRIHARPGSDTWPVKQAIVLDPFCGSGTVGAVALKHGRQFIGLDLSAPYLKLARERIEAAEAKK